MQIVSELPMFAVRDPTGPVHSHTLQWPTDGRRFPEPGLLCGVSEGFKLPLKINTELNCVQPAGTGSHFLSGFNTLLGLYGLCTVEMNKLH